MKSWLKLKKIKIKKGEMFIQTNQRGKKDSNKILNESGDITANTIERQMIIRDYYEQLFANILDKLEKTTS